MTRNALDDPKSSAVFCAILPRAEVPRDLDIVPLPPGTFLHQNRAFFYSAFFPCILNKFRLHLYHRRMPNA